MEIKYLDMKTIDKYKNEIRKMFIVSVKKDIDKWVGDKLNYYSPYFDSFCFNVDLSKGTLYLYDGESYTGIVTYERFFIPIDREVNRSVKKLKRYFIQKREDEKMAIKIDILKKGLNKIQEKYVKEVRKEKLDKINNE